MLKAKINQLIPMHAAEINGEAGDNQLEHLHGACKLTDFFDCSTNTMKGHFLHLFSEKKLRSLFVLFFSCSQTIMEKEKKKKKNGRNYDSKLVYL